MYKLILFDLGGVVFTNGTKRFINDISSRYGIPPETTLNVLDGDIGTKYREGQIGRDQFWKLVLENLPLKESEDDLEKEWIGDYDLIPGTKEIIEKLRSEYKVMYLSDNVKERVDNLDARFGFVSWFDGGIFSHEVGVRKPNPKIYEFALQKGEAKPEETIFIDDKPKMIEPATMIGITGIVFESPEKLKKELIRIGVITDDK
jgi:HAD superfamily hydrolase (TIGR01509 family)